MDPLLTSMLDARLNSKFELYDRGDLLFPAFLKPCRLKILIVTDGYNNQFLTGSFSHSYFGLSALLDTLRLNPEFFVKFDITRAHRQIDQFKPDPVADPVAHSRYGPHFENFRFTQGGFDINQFHQVWFFGTRSDENSTEALSDAEAAVIARWMDEKQGGVFAVGDHATIGASLCKKIPRVRSMRKWTAAQGVPSNFGPDRHDTNRKGHDAVYTFDDESDDIPMPIQPKFYPLASWSPFQIRRAPHPVLCGTDGVIDILPDHPHEGWVNEEADIALGATFSFPGYTNKPEYPNVGGQPKPEVIARASILADHQPSDFKGVVNAKTFPCIGAYNGFGANVGRVVVDSTWHHWFDVNLTGRAISSLDSTPMNGTNPKTQGFLFSPAGQAALARIQNYFRNVAMWLAPPAQQSCMFFRATWGTIIRYPAVEQVSPLLPLWQLGGVAKDAIGRRAGQCTLTKWILDIIPPDLVKVFERPPLDIDIDIACPPFEVLELFVLGGLTRELLTFAYENGDAKGINEKELAKRFESGVRLGIAELNDTLRKSAERVNRNVAAFPDVKRLKINTGALTTDPGEPDRPVKKTRK